MSLAWRIFLFALLLNVITLGSVQVFVHYSQQQWFRNARAVADQSVRNGADELRRVYSADSLRDSAAAALQVHRLISNPMIREQYDDVIVISGQPPYDDVYLNPRGAVHRDPDRFPQGAIVAAMQTAREVDGFVPVADGICLALLQDGSAVGFVWFLPRHPDALPASLPFWSSVVALAIGAALFGMVLFVAIRRTVGVPPRGRCRP